MSSGWSMPSVEAGAGVLDGKGALNAMTQALAAELGGRGVTVNTVAPGWTAIDGNAEERKDPALVAQATRTRFSAAWPTRLTSAG